MTYFELLAEQDLHPRYVKDEQEITVKCPLCEDHQSRLYVNSQSGMWICFHCEESGGPYRLCREVLGLDHFEIRSVLAKVDSLASSAGGVRKAYYHRQRPPTEPVKEGIDLPDAYLPLTNPNASLERVFWRYLFGRGVTEEDVKTYQIGFCLHGLYQYRVIIPVYTGGVLWTFVARTVLRHEPKVLHPKGAQPSKALFGLDQWIPGPTVVVVEGAFDAIRLKGMAVATLGTNFSTDQRQLLHSYGVKQVCLLWDGDEAGRHGASIMAGRLGGAGFDVGIALLPEGEDPASASVEQIEAAFKIRLPLSSLGGDGFLSQRLLEKTLDLNVPS